MLNSRTVAEKGDGAAREKDNGLAADRIAADRGSRVAPLPTARAELAVRMRARSIETIV